MFEQMSSGRIKGAELCINCIASLHREELFQVKDCSPSLEKKTFIVISFSHYAKDNEMFQEQNENTNEIFTQKMVRAR